TGVRPVDDLQADRLEEQERQEAVDEEYRILDSGHDPGTDKREDHHRHEEVRDRLDEHPEEAAPALAEPRRQLEQQQRVENVALDLERRACGTVHSGHGLYYSRRV